MTVITDTFTRADNSSSLGSSSEGWSWTALGGAVYGINSNRAYLASGPSASGPARAESDLGNADHYAKVTLATGVASAAQVGPCVRMSAAAATFYSYRKRGSDVPSAVFKCVSGSQTLLATGATSAVSPGDILELDIVGSALTCKYNGATDITTTDGSITGNSRAGYIDNNGVSQPGYLNYFEAGQFSSTFTRDTASGTEALSTLRRETTLDASALTGLLSDRVAQPETLSALMRDGACALECQATLAIDRVTAAELASALLADRAATAEASVVIVRDTEASPELVALVRLDRSAFAEALVSLASDKASALESTVAISLTVDAGAALEIISALNRDERVLIEFEGLAVVRVTAPYRTRTVFLPSRELIVWLSPRVVVVPALWDAATPLRWPGKRPAEVLDFGLDFTAELDGDTISAVAWAAPDGSIALSASSFTNAVASIWLASGEAGRDYQIKCDVTTTLGREFSRLVSIAVDVA